MGPGPLATAEKLTVDECRGQHKGEGSSRHVIPVHFEELRYTE